LRRGSCEPKINIDPERLSTFVQIKEGTFPQLLYKKGKKTSARRGE